MRVLLTGASGFLGRHALDSLERCGVEVVALGRTRPHVPVKFIKADLLSVRDLRPFLREADATHLLHLAWYAEHGKYWSSPLNLRWVDATTRLVESFCDSGGRRVVVAGTCAEYDWKHGCCEEESTPLAPATLYGLAKDVTRRLVMAICTQHQASCGWGRVFIPFGRWESVERLIPSLIEVFQGVRPPFGVNALAYRDFLHASDVADGLIRLLSQDSNETYNISSGEPTRLSEVVLILADLLDADPAPILELASERSGEPLLLLGNSLKLRALGWRPVLNLRQGLVQTLRGDSE